MNPTVSKLLQSDKVIHKLDRIEKHGVGALLAEKSDSKALKKIDLYYRARFSHLKRLFNQISDRLNDQKIDFLVMKGFSYSFWLYSNTHFRPYSDIDLFLPKSSYDQVEEILISLGFKRFNSLQGKIISQQNSFLLDDQYQTTFDIHWQVNNRQECSIHFPFEPVRKRSMTIERSEICFQTPNPIDSMLIGAFHYYGHKPKDRKHIWLYDLSLIWSSMTSQQKSQCVTQSIQNELSQILFETLKLLSTVFPKVINEPYFEINRNEPSALYIPHGSSFRLRLKNTNGLANKATLLKELLIPDSDHLMQLFHLKRRRWAWIYLPRYWWKALSKK